MRRWIVASVLGGTTLITPGCQGPWRGGLWSKASTPAGAAVPAGNQQRFGGLAGETGTSGQVALGGQKPPAQDNFLLASWKKTTAAVTGGAAAAKASLPEDDPLRLDRLPQKIGPEVYVGAARLLENQGKFDEAEAKYREALKVAPRDLAALIGLARLYDRQGQGAKALELYRAAAKAHPDSSLVFNDLGLCYRRQRQTEAAIEALRKAVALKPQEPKYRNNLAAALVEAGQREEALQQLLAVHPPAAAHYNLAYLLQQQGETGAAADHLRRALQHDPALSAARQMLAQLGLDTPEAESGPQIAPPSSLAAAAQRPSTAPQGTLVPPPTVLSETQPPGSSQLSSDYTKAADPTSMKTPPVVVAPWAAEPQPPVAEYGTKVHDAPGPVATAEPLSSAFKPEETPGGQLEMPASGGGVLQPSLPQVQRPVPPSYHIGDEGVPMGEAPRESRYRSAAWVFPAGSPATGGPAATSPSTPPAAGRRLPPVD